jgi:hypothetical protein
MVKRVLDLLKSVSKLQYALLLELTGLIYYTYLQVREYDVRDDIDLVPLYLGVFLSVFQGTGFLLGIIAAYTKANELLEYYRKANLWVVVAELIIWVGSLVVSILLRSNGDFSEKKILSTLVGSALPFFGLSIVLRIAHTMWAVKLKRTERKRKQSLD